MSPLNTGVVKFRAPDGTIAELVEQCRFPRIRRRRIKPCAISPLGNAGRAVADGAMRHVMLDAEDDRRWSPSSGGAVVPAACV